jgi:hypothetical protein
MDDIRKGICPLCGHNEVLEAPAVTSNPAVLSGPPVPVGVVPIAPPGFLSSFKRALSDNPSSGEAGRLMVYACRGCGYSQLFITDAGAITPSELEGRRLIKGPDPIGPYR